MWISLSMKLKVSWKCDFGFDRRFVLFCFVYVLFCLRFVSFCLRFVLFTFRFVYVSFCLRFVLFTFRFVYVSFCLRFVLFTFSGNSRLVHVKVFKWVIIYGLHGIYWKELLKILVWRSAWIQNQFQGIGMEPDVIPITGSILGIYYFVHIIFPKCPGRKASPNVPCAKLPQMSRAQGLLNFPPEHFSDFTW